MTNFSEMLSKAKEMQEKMKQVQDNLKKIEVEGVSGGNSCGPRRWLDRLQEPAPLRARRPADGTEGGSAPAAARPPEVFCKEKKGALS